MIFKEILRIIIGEKTWKSKLILLSKVIRGEGYRNYDQPQRIDGEKI